MNTEKKLLILFLLLFLTLGIIVYYSRTQNNKNSFIYHGAKGDYRIDIQTIGNQTDYIVYANSPTQNITYLVPLKEKPQDVENISLEPDLLSKIQRPQGTRKVYLTEDYQTPNLTKQISVLALIDIGKILGRAEYGIYKLDVQGAVTSSTDHSRSLEVPEITCTNVNATTSVIYVKLGQENKVYSDHDCIIVEGKDSKGITLASTKFAYYLLGVF